MQDRTTILLIWFFCLLTVGFYIGYSPEALNNVPLIGTLAISGGYLIYKTIVVFGDFSETPIMSFRLSYWLMWFFYALTAYVVFVSLLDKLPGAFLATLFTLLTVFQLCYTYLYVRFRSGIKRNGTKINIPLLSGEVVIDPEEIKIIETRKWILGRAFGYSTARLFFRNGHELDVLLPDALLEEAGLTS